MTENQTLNKINDYSDKKKVWVVFTLLSVITIAEVALGIWKPDFLHLTTVLGTSPLNILFILLTVAKAYYIAWFFMHLSHEKKPLRNAIIWTSAFLMIFVTLLLLIEGSYIQNVLGPLTRW
jgi:cytochrome c oxidase subunit IV